MEEQKDYITSAKIQLEEKGIVSIEDQLIAWQEMYSHAMNTVYELLLRQKIEMCMEGIPPEWKELAKSQGIIEKIN